jgi:outer membrane autotransporter protein
MSSVAVPVEGTGPLELAGNAFKIWGGETRAYTYASIGAAEDNEPSVLTIETGATLTTNQLGSTDAIGKAVGVYGEVCVDGANSKWNSSVNLFHVGEFGEGVLRITNGGKVSSMGTGSSNIIGKAADSIGAVYVNGVGSLWDASFRNLYVGESGHGVLKITNGGKVTAAQAFLDTFIIARYAGSRGEVEVSGTDSLLETVGAFWVGYNGVGQLLIKDGGSVIASDFGTAISGDVNIGANPDSVSGSSVTVQGAGSTLEGSTVNLGHYDNAKGELITSTLDILDGGVVTSHSGMLDGGTVTVSGADSSWTMTHNLSVATYGRSIVTLLITDGATVETNTYEEELCTKVGGNDGAQGTVIVAKGGRWTAHSELILGTYGTGSLDVRSGGIVSTKNATLGERSSQEISAFGVGEATISGEGSSWEVCDELIVGSWGEGRLVIENKGKVTAANVGIAVESGSCGTLTLRSGGVLEVEDLTIGNGVATFDINGGGIRAMAGAGDFFSNATSFDLNAEGLAADVAALTFDTQSYAVTLSSNVGGTGILRKTGEGELTFAGELGSNATLDLTAGDIVMKGTVYGTTQVGGNGTLHLDTACALAANAVISGTGTVTAVSSGSVFDGTRAILSPGSAADPFGVLTLGGSDKWCLDGITLRVKLGESGTSSSVHSLGDVDFGVGGSNTIALTNTTWQQGTYTLLTVQGDSTFAAGDLSDSIITYKGVALGSGPNLRLQSAVTLAGDGNSLVLTTKAANPLSLTWNASPGSDHIWENESSDGWKSGDVSGQSFCNGDAVTFGEGNLQSNFQVADAGVIVSAMTVTGSYNFAGGAIVGLYDPNDAGSGLLTVDQNAVVVFDNEVNFEKIVNNGSLTAGTVTGNVINLGSFAAQRIVGDVNNTEGSFVVGNVTGTVNNHGTITLLGNTTWGALANGGLIRFRNAGETLTITGDLVQLPGQYSRFALDVDLAPSAPSDCIVVGGQVQGAHHLLLTATNERLSGNLGGGIVVLSAPNDTTGDETITGEVFGVLNTYDIGLTADGKGYALTRVIGPSPSARVLTETLGAMSIAWFAQMDSVAKRFGELRATSGTAADTGDLSFWMRARGQQVNAHLGAGVSKFREHQYGGDLGADKAFTLGDGQLYLGAFLGYGLARRDFRDGLGSKSDTDSISGGLYATYAGAGGLYADATIKGQYFDHEYRIPSTLLDQHGQFDNMGVGVSLEIGQRLDLGATAGATVGTGCFLEPAMRFDYAHIFAENFGTSHGMRVKASDSDLYRFATDLRGGVRFSVNEESWLQLGGTLGAQYQLGSGGAIRLSDAVGNSVRHVPTTNGLRAIVGLDLAWQMSATSGLHLNYEAAFGEKYDIPWNLNLSWRNRF